jgi:hypothetical protein
MYCAILKNLIIFLAFVCLNNAEAMVFKSQDIYVDSEISPRDNWREIASDDDLSLKELLKIIQKSKTGRKILLKAKKKANAMGLTVVDIFRVGSGSLTDTTLVRRFSPHNPFEVSYELSSLIYINQELNTMDAILDMAHELTHYVYRPAFNPYKGQFTLKSFVESTVEGLGGEVEAYLNECRVLKDIFSKEFFKNSKCQKVYDATQGTFSKKMGINEFYKVGRYWKGMEKRIGRFQLSSRDFPKLGKERAIFISSAYGRPYPVAAVDEYEFIMERVCKNDLKRLEIMENQIEEREEILDSRDKMKAYHYFKTSFKGRCIHFSPQKHFVTHTEESSRIKNSALAH